MLGKRDDHANEQKSHAAHTLTGGEYLRVASDSASKNDGRNGSGSEEEKISLFWRIFGGTILSMVALGVFTLYNSISGNISDIRRELSQEREARAGLVPKKEFQDYLAQQAERQKAIETIRGEFEGLRERVNTNAAVVDALKRDTTAALEGHRKELTATFEASRKELNQTIDAIKKDLAVIETLRERVTAVEMWKKEIAAIETLRERLATIATDHKSVREELVRLQQEIERNKAADQERKMLRDEQYKLIDQTLRELQKELQGVREKLVRLESLAGQIAPRPAEVPAEPKGDVPGKKVP